MLFSVRCSTTLPSESSMTVLRIGQILGGQPKIDRVLRHDVKWHFRLPEQPIRRLALEHLAVGFAEHLDMTERVVPIIRAEVEIIERECFLEHGGVGLLRNREEGRVVVAHVVTSDDSRVVRQSVRMLVIGRAQQQQGRVDCATGEHHDFGGILLRVPLPLDVNRRNGAAGRIGLQPAHECVGQERHIRMLECRVDADDLSVGLAIDEARIAIEGVAADAGAGVPRLAVLLVEQNAERKRKRMIAAPLQAVPELLYAWLVRDGRVTIRPARGRFGRIHTMLAVDMVEMLGLAIERLEVLISKRPGRRNSAVMPDLTEVLLAQTKQRCAVKLGIAANVIMDTGLERLAVLAVPGLLCFVFRFEKDRRSVPILLLARQEIAALQYEDSLARGRQSIGERTASRAGADDDDVVSVGGHDLLPGCAVLTLLCSEAWHVYCVLLEPAAIENAAPMLDVIQLGAHDVRSTCQQSICVGGGEHSYQGRDQVDPEPLPGAAWKR